MAQPARPSRRTSGIACVALAAALGLLPACNKARDAAAEGAMEHATAQDVDLKRDGDAMTIKSGDAEIKIAAADDGGALALPADFPGDVFLPAQHAVNSAMDMDGMQMVNLTTPLPPAAVTAEVEQAMQAQGWKREMAKQAEGSSTLIYAKDKRQVVYQIVKSAGGGTQLAIRAGGS